MSDTVQHNKENSCKTQYPTQTESITKSTDEIKQDQDSAIIQNQVAPALYEKLTIDNNFQQISTDQEIEDQSEESNARRPSLQESDVIFQEVDERDEDIRRKINLKLIKNKNYFMDFMRADQKKIGYENNEMLANNSVIGDQQQQEKSQLIMVGSDKRSRSETPDKMSATDVLYRAHLKLQQRRKMSPSKLLEKHEERQVKYNIFINIILQRKAQELRAQIESSRKSLLMKMRDRQFSIKKRWMEMLALKKAKLFGRLEQAEERKEREIMGLKNKAKQELQKIDETNFIKKMTMSNMKIDMDQKMSETVERRQHLLEEFKQKQHQRMEMKMSAAEKRRQELQQKSEKRFENYQRKQEQADQRRKLVLFEKQKVAADDLAQRAKILQRKNELGDKISDIMSFISNSENIWDFLSNELDWSDLDVYNEQDGITYKNCMGGDIYGLLSKDHYEIEKLKLKKDAEILNQLIIITEDGKIFGRKELLNTALKKIQRQGGVMEQWDSSSGSEDIDEEVKEFVITQAASPNKQQLEGGYYSDYSEVDENIKNLIVNTNCSPSKNQQKSNITILNSNSKVNVVSDEDLNYQIYANRVKMSMKRNILKKNLSEDLTWADFLKNDFYFQKSSVYNPLQQQYNRSLHSTPERKHDITSESDEKESNQRNSLTSSTGTKNDKSSVIRSGANNQATGSRSSTVKFGQSNANAKNSSSNQTSSGHHQTSSNSQQSDKSRVSQTVYPSKKKKNPNNSKQNVDLKQSASQNSIKKLGSGVNSNQNSSQSLVMNFHSNTGSFVNNVTLDTHSKPQLNENRKSVQIDQLDSSGRKQQISLRLHSSSVQEQAHNSSIFQNAIDDNNDIQSIINNTGIHTGTQMTQLLTNHKPQPPNTKLVPKKLTANAVKLLFPIKEQKLLFKRPGKEGQFAKSRIIVKIEDLTHTTNTPSKSQQLSSLHIQHQQSEKSGSQQVLASIENSSSNIHTDSLHKQLTIEQQTSSSSKKSLQSTPQLSGRKQSGEGQQKDQQTSQEQQINSNSPPQQTPQNRIQSQHIKLQSFLNFESKIPKISGSKMGSNLPSENSPSPRKDLDLIQQQLKTVNEEPISQVNTSILTQSQNQSQLLLIDTQQQQMNEQGYKELILKILMTDNIQLLKNEESQKSIVLDGSNEGIHDKLIDFLEQHDFQLRYCRLCDLLIPDHLTNEAHTQLKSHKRTREDLGIKEAEDLAYSILSFLSVPGDIDKELVKEKEKALKRKVKRIKAQMATITESHESASACPGKEITSQNKKRLQILCMDLEKQVIPIIKDYEALENSLKEVIKILDLRKQADLHVMRKLKFIPILIEICKRIQVCHKSEYKHLGKVLEFVIKIINAFCSGLRENRNYMLQTNRLQALIELLLWCLNRPTQLFYGITFLPQLFHILTAHIKHRVPYECQQMKELFLEYLVCSQITTKIKGKLQIINGPLDLSEMIGQVPLILLKCATFIEALTSIISLDAKSRPVYEKSSKIGEQVFFVLQNNELFGIIPMITTMLLTRNQPFKPSTQSGGQPTQLTKVLPQTILSLAIISIKIINNVFRMDYKFTQSMLTDLEIQEQLYHLFNYLLFYSSETVDQCEDSKELLHETVLMIGYFTLNNEKNQQMLCRGENTLLQKLCGLPFPYFCDKKLKEILFPTLISSSYKNDRSLAIMDQELSIELIVDFIQMNLKDELPKIVEEELDCKSISSVGNNNGTGAIDRKTNRSPSLSSTNSSNCSMQVDLINGNSPYLPLVMRFPKKQWKDAITFYSKVLF